MRSLNAFSRLVPLAAVAVLGGTLQLACGFSDASEFGSSDEYQSGAGAGNPGPPLYPDGGGEFKIPIGQKEGSPFTDDLFEACAVGMCTAGGDPMECATGGSTMLGDSGPQQVFCQIVPVEDHLESRCLQVGTQTETKACKTSADCAAGLGCVGSPTGGVCRQYCCGDPEAMCPQDTYCARAPLAGYPQYNSSMLDIPVCVPATKCQLLDVTACPDPDPTQPEICTIVRADGTTSCVKAGTGTVGQDCPCADGHVCIHSINQCMQLCHIGMNNECAAGAKCLGGSASYPEGFGVCVGG